MLGYARFRLFAVKFVSVRVFYLLLLIKFINKVRLPLRIAEVYIYMGTKPCTYISMTLLHTLSRHDLLDVFFEKGSRKMVAWMRWHGLRCSCRWWSNAVRFIS